MHQSLLSPSDEEEEEEDGNDDDECDYEEPAPQRLRFTEEDLYCRIGSCLWAFKDPRMCTKHRHRHFPYPWYCPGPCREVSTKKGRFARNETLKRHLCFEKNGACREAVLKVLKLKNFPLPGSAWLAPLRDGPERPWEIPGFQLTDLKTVKENIMKLRNSDCAAPAAVFSNGRRRYK